MTDLHRLRHDDWAHSGCAWCGERIPPGAPRQWDVHKNLYCSVECMGRAGEFLRDRAEARP